MKLKTYKKDLQEALKKVILEKKAALPILTNFMLKAEDGKLTIYGTDLEVYTTYSIFADIEEEGSICVNAKKLVDISKVLGKEDISIYTDKENLKITSGKTKYSLSTLEPDDYPLPEKFPSNATVLVSGKELLKGISKTIYAASKDSSRFALNGVCFTFNGNKLELVATDGHRLALYNIQIAGKGIEGKYIVPTKALNELKKLAYAEDEIDINYDGQEFEIGFNGKYILEAVDKIDSDNIIVKFINKDSQTTFIPENQEEKYLALVMPMTLT
jgi:DNA polymerase-3 subunit beta